MKDRTVELYKGVAQTGTAATVVRTVFLSKWSFNPYQKLLGERLAEIGVQPESIDLRLLFLPGLLKQLGSDIDIMHLQSIHPLFAIPSRRKALIRLVLFVTQLVIVRLMGIRIVWTTHDIKNHKNRNMRIDRIGTRVVAWMAEAIIIHCETAKKQVMKTFKIRSPDKVFVVPHGNYVDYYQNDIGRKEARKLLGLSHSSTVYLFLGWISEYKGVPEMIDAFKRLDRNDTQLVIAGKTSSDSLDHLIKTKIAHADNIHYKPGFVPDAEIQVYMNACDVAVFPYRDILTSGAVLLAMSFARACVAPRKSCLGEVLDDEGGFLYDCNNEEGLIGAMRSAAGQNKRLLHMGEHNRRIVERWNWRLVAKMTKEVYQKCLNQQKLLS
jgi:beta-1,4-mannosyltransferase